MINFTIPALLWTSPKTGKVRAVIDAKYTEGQRPNWTRKRRYEEWKQYVQERATLAGLELPLRATMEKPICIVTVAYFASKVHPDCSNVWEGIADALCYVSPEERKLGVKRGSDKYVGGAFASPQYSKGDSRVEVWICDEVAEMIIHLRRQGASSG